MKGNIRMRQEKISLPNRFCRISRHKIPLFSVPGRRGFLSAVRAASMTVEAAAALPLFFLAVVSLICMMDLYGTFSEQVVKLQEQAETAGTWVSAVGDHAPSVIDLPVGFTYRPQWYPAALPAVRIAVRGRVHAWTGRDLSEQTEVPEETGNEEMVYVTEHESVYHTSAECTHLSLSVQAVSGSRVGQLRNEDGKAYHACDKCAGSGVKNSTVYVAREGTHYHNDANCSGLTRTVRLVKKSETSDLHICSRCQQHAGKE